MWFEIDNYNYGLPVVLPKVKCMACYIRNLKRDRGPCRACLFAPARPQPKKPGDSGRRGVGNGNRNAPLPTETTDAEPGSFAKLAVLESRMTRGEQLFHPADNNWLRWDDS